MKRTLKVLQIDQHGATAIEYGLLVALITLAIIGGLSAVSGSMIDIFTSFETTFAPVNK